MALDNIAALLIQPPVGAWSDRIRTPLGRRIPFILVGAPIAALTFGIIPIAAALPLLIICGLTFLLTMAFWRAPFFALLPDVTPSQYRSQANGVINTIGVSGAMLAFLGAAPFYGKNPAYPFWIASFLLLLTTALVIVFLRDSGSPQTDQDQKAGILKTIQEVWQDTDKSALRVLLAILLVFISNNAADAFITLYSVNRLGLTPADGARFMGQLTVSFILFAIPAGFIGAYAGRKVSICFGILIMALCALAQYVLAVSVLNHQIGSLPLIGLISGASLAMMLTGAGWSLVHTNSLPMVLDMTTPAKVGTYIGLYYLFSTFGAILGPIINGWVVQLSGLDYRMIMLVSPFFLFLAFLMMLGVRRGESAVVDHTGSAGTISTVSNP